MNKMIKDTANKYCNEFNELFIFTKEGELDILNLKLNEIEKWYNNNYLMIGIINAVILEKIKFNYLSKNDENKIILLEIYKICNNTKLHYDKLLCEIIDN